MLVLRGRGGQGLLRGLGYCAVLRLEDGLGRAVLRGEDRESPHRDRTLARATVAAIEGLCFGSGVLLAAACDLRVAAKGRVSAPVSADPGQRALRQLPFAGGGQARHFDAHRHDCERRVVTVEEAKDAWVCPRNGDPTNTTSLAGGCPGLRAERAPDVLVGEGDPVSDAPFVDGRRVRRPGYRLPERRFRPWGCCVPGWPIRELEWHMNDGPLDGTIVLDLSRRSLARSPA